jgi:hypothetical protein
MRHYRLRTSPIVKLAALAAALCFAAVPLASPAQVTIGFTIGQAPPPLPYYTQPELTQPGQVWQPGYWAWGPAGYYWVPGTWVTPPQTGLYWTPGYWGYDNGSYAWNNGYWAPQVGYYGGVNYGYGYYGSGYYGAQWRNNQLFYNTAASLVAAALVPHVYVNRYGIVERVPTRTYYSFNGPGGVIYRPNAREIVVMHERHIAPTVIQVEHARLVSQNRYAYYVVNRGRPAMVTVVRPVTTVRAMPHYETVTAADRREVINKTVTHTRTVEGSKATTTTTTRTHETIQRNAPTHATATKPPAEHAKATTTTTEKTKVETQHNTPTHAQANDTNKKDKDDKNKPPSF